jgi:hypothetical protein
VRIAIPGVLLLAACAGTAPIPSASLFAAQQAILVAEREYASDSVHRAPLSSLTARRFSV